MAAIEHLSPAEALDFSMGDLTAARRAEAEAHLADCHRCRTMLAEVLKSSDLSDGEPEPPAPLQVGRFVVLRNLGVGAMGMVFAAYDPHLDRQVALKLRRASLGESDKQVLVEARAMARLTHPNIVGVYEVGVTGETIFLVMEYVQGCSLREYAIRHRNEPSRVLSAFVQAGRGLAAAHLAGVVHRDFKPENVLVDDEERTRVTDFGLASLNSESGVVGTPVYMAPEVLAKQRATEASDQFSFCISVYEALTGRRPWEGGNELKREGPLPRIPANRASARVRRAVERGLSLDPDARFPSMNALVSELVVRSEETTALRALLLVTSLAALGSLAYSVVQASGQRCNGEEALEAGWTEERSRAFAAAAPAEVTAVEAWTKQWVDEFRTTCEEGRRRQAVSTQVTDTRMRCLEDRLRGFLVSTELAERQPERAHKLVATLAPPAICRAAPTIGTWPAPTLAAGELATQRKRLTEATALREAGLASDALERAEALLKDVKPEQALELVSRASYERALLIRVGHLDEADRLLLWVFQQALRSGDDELATLSAMARSRTIGAFGGRSSEALAQAEIARGLMERLPVGHRYVTSFHWVWGEALMNAGRLEEAEEVLVRGSERATAPGTNEYRHLIEYSLANVHFVRGAWERALVHAQKALGFARAYLPAQSPGLVLYLIGVALPQLHLRGSTPEARALLDEAEAVLKLVPEAQVVGSWASLFAARALEARGRGNFEEAYEFSRRSDERYRTAFPHRDAETTADLLQAALHAGRAKEVELAQKRLLSVSPTTPAQKAWRGAVLAMAARSAGQREAQREAVAAIVSKELAFPMRLWAMLEQGEWALDSKQPREAVTQCETLRTQLEVTPMAPFLTSSVWFFCARALWESDHAQARTVLEAARPGFSSGLVPLAERRRFEAFAASSGAAPVHE